MSSSPVRSAAGNDEEPNEKRGPAWQARKMREAMSAARATQEVWRQCEVKRHEGAAAGVLCGVYCVRR